MKFQKLKSPKMSEAVASQIIRMIEAGTLKPGTKLPTEQELISSFGISRTALREGMQRLLMINAIEIRPGVGTFVLGLKKEDLIKVSNLRIIKNKKRLREVIELRKIIELGIIDLAIDRASKSDIKKIEECLESHKKGAIKNIFPAKGDIEFHKMLTLATHNKEIINFYEDIFKLILKSVVVLKEYETVYKKSLKYHKNILDAFKKGDKESAKKAMSDHLSWLIELI